MAKPKYQYDVFISHAVEDKIPIANDLNKALRDRGLQVWYSGKELSVGDELTETIYQGLDQSRYGVVIISPTYLRKVWALGEFFRLTQRRGKAVLPVFYEITPEEIGERYPPMANLVGVSMSAGMDVVVDKLYSVIKGDTGPENTFLEKLRKYVQDQYVRLTALITILLVLGGAASFALLSKMSQGPSADHVDKEVVARITLLQHAADKRLHGFIDEFRRKPAVVERVNAIYQRFWNTKSYYRNEYELILPNRVEIRGRRNVELKLQQHMQDFTPAKHYRMSGAQAYLDSSSYMFYNTNPISYTVTRAGYKDNHYEVTVTYAEGVRLVYTQLDFPESEKDTKRHHVIIDAVPPTETYSFVQKGDVWELQEIR